MTEPTRRVTLHVAGAELTRFQAVTIGRDLRNIHGEFDVTCVDVARAMQALPVNLDRPPFLAMIREGMACTLAIDGDVVLDGYIDDIDPVYSATGMGMRVAGRDRTGDLADCAALPDGPAEFRGVDLLHVAQLVCAPFNITVRAEADVGAPFERLALRPHETALQFLEGAARQRSILLVSDGVGGLLLTRGGITRGADKLAFGVNILQARIQRSWRRRFSDVYVKGQTDAAGRRGGVSPALDHTAVPLTAGTSPPASPAAAATEAASIVMTGHARDPEITRWRPTVRLTRSQSGMSSAQEQAEWAVRVARGEGDNISYTVADWRAGGERVLWRPNTVVGVEDPYADIDKDMLIAGVTYRFGEQGEITELRVAGVTAFDRINEAQKRRTKWKDKKSAKGAGDSTAVPLTAP